MLTAEQDMKMTSQEESRVISRRRRQQSRDEPSIWSIMTHPAP